MKPFFFIEEIFVVRRFRQPNHSLSIWVFLLCFVFSKGIVPMGFMPGSAQNGEWLVLCSVNGTKSVFIPDVLGESDPQQDAGHQAGFDESCYLSIGSTALAGEWGDLSVVSPDSTQKYHAIINSVFYENTRTLQPIRGPPSYIS